ncbi:MAG TPA: hypothetical protein VK427_02375 [Kofleriaceae bacterium]|nr:hypothetical protein [Kofleriaceae bacterium]
MKLVEPEAEGPIEGEEPIVTPPRPPHRRVSVSFLFTLTVLVGTVVAIYMAFPARHNLLLTEAIEAHRETEPKWDLVEPTPDSFRGWAIGVAGKDVPLPPAEAKVLAARAIDIHDRRAALVRLALGTDELTYLVQHGRGVAPKRNERTDGELHAVSWRAGKFTCVLVGPAATKQAWGTSIASKK